MNRPHDVLRDVVSRCIREGAPVLTNMPARDTTTFYRVWWTTHYPERATISQLREYGCEADGSPFDSLVDAIEWMVTDTDFDFDGESTLPDLDTFAHLAARGGVLVDGMFATGEPIRYMVESVEATT